MDSAKTQRKYCNTSVLISGLNVILMFTGVESVLLRNWATSQDSLEFGLIYSLHALRFLTSQF